MWHSHTAGGGTPARRLLGDERRALLSAVSLPGRLSLGGKNTAPDNTDLKGP